MTRVFDVQRQKAVYVHDHCALKHGSLGAMFRCEARQIRRLKEGMTRC